MSYFYMLGITLILLSPVAFLIGSVGRRVSSSWFPEIEYLFEIVLAFAATLLTGGMLLILIRFMAIPFE